MLGCKGLTDPGKISTQPLAPLCIQFLINGQNNSASTGPLSFVLSLFSVFSPLKLYPQVQNYDHLFKNISTGPLVSTGVPLREGGLKNRK